MWHVPVRTSRYLPVTGKSGFGWLSGRPSRRAFANRICDWGLLREAYAASFYEQNLRCGVHKACVKGRSWAGPKRRWSALPVGGSGVSRGSWPATSQGSNEPQTQVCGTYFHSLPGTGMSLVGRVSAGSQGGLRGELLRRESAIGVFSGQPTRRAFTNRIRAGAPTGVRESEVLGGV